MANITTLVEQTACRPRFYVKTVQALDLFRPLLTSSIMWLRK